METGIENPVVAFCTYMGWAAPDADGQVHVFQGISGDDRVHVTFIPDEQKVRLEAFFDGCPKGEVDVWLQRLGNGDLTVQASCPGRMALTMNHPTSMAGVVERMPTRDYPWGVVGLLRQVGGGDEVFRLQS